MFEILVGSKFKFMEKRKVTYVISLVLVLASIGALVMRGGPRESIDFTGGSLLYVEFPGEVEVGSVRSAAESAGLAGAVVQMAEGNTQAIIHYQEGHDSAFEALESAYGSELTLMSQETVGPKIGEELERKAGLAILWSLLLILGYIAFRFSRISFGLAAVAALFHDILITLGLFTFFNIEVSLVVVAAFLTIGGYSINDTIVVFDRIRENLGASRRLSFEQIVDKSVNQTLSRTVLTSGTTLAAVLALYLFGGVVIHDFALAMLIGVVIGTYSSIFVASALALDLNAWWVRRRQGKIEGTPAKARTAAAR